MHLILLKVIAHSNKLPFYNAAILLKIIFLSLNLLLFMSVMLDLILVGFAELCKTGTKIKIF